VSKEVIKLEWMAVMTSIKVSFFSTQSVDGLTFMLYHFINKYCPLS